MTAKTLLVVVALCVFAHFPANAQRPPPTKLVVATIEVLGITPTSPLEGQPFKVDYRITNVSPLNSSVSGNVRATYGSSSQLQSANGVPKKVSVETKSSLDGAFTFTAGSPGAQAISIQFIVCPPTAPGRRQCVGKAVRVIAGVDTTVVVMRDLVQMRIPGNLFIQFDRKDSRDEFKIKAGFLCVEHNPGCGAQGNNGTDGYLPTFPPGAIYEGVDFKRYWPEGLSNDMGGFPINDAGSYGANIAYAQPSVPPAFPSVRWHNTCLAGSPAKGQSVYYSISFRVSVPRGTDLGPDAVPVDQSGSSPCSALPDFGIKISDVEVKPRDYVNPGSPIEIDWQITTYGTCQPANVTLFSQLYNEQRKKIASLSPPTRSYKLTAPSVSGFIDYIVYAECSGAPASGKDDKVTLQVPPGTPDKSYALTVDGPSIRPDPPLIEKKPFAVEWNIINSGAAEAPTFNVQLYLDDVQVGEEKEVAKLLPGNSTPVTWTVTKEIVGSPHHVELRNAKNQASLGYREFMVIPGP